jgi:hypothetical protein
MTTTEKISITIGRDEVRRARQMAARLGMSLSTFISDAVRQRTAAQGRQEAARAVLATFAPDERPTAEEMRVLLARWQPNRSPDVSAERSRKPRSKVLLRPTVQRRSA